MVLEQQGRFDRRLVAAVNKDNAVAGETGQRRFRHRLGGGGQQRGHLRSGLAALARPAGHFTNICESDVDPALRFGDLGEDRRFLGAGDGHRLTGRCRIAEAFEFRAAKLPPFDHLGAAARAPQRRAVERHRIVAGTNQNLARRMRHRVSNLRPLYPAGVGRNRVNL